MSCDTVNKGITTTTQWCSGKLTSTGALKGGDVESPTATRRAAEGGERFGEGNVPPPQWGGVWGGAVPLPRKCFCFWDVNISLFSILVLKKLIVKSITNILTC